MSGGSPKFRRPAGGRTIVSGLCFVSLSWIASQLAWRELPLSRQRRASWPFWDECCLSKHTLGLWEEAIASGQRERRSQGSSSELLWGNGWLTQKCTRSEIPVILGLGLWVSVLLSPQGLWFWWYRWELKVGAPCSFASLTLSCVEAPPTSMPQNRRHSTVCTCNSSRGRAASPHFLSIYPLLVNFSLSATLICTFTF